MWLGNGSNLILQWIFEAFGGPGRRALVPRPSFSLYGMWGRISETEVEEFPLGERFEYRADEVVERIERRSPAITVLCLPNNPTGSELEPAAVGRIALAAERAGGILVVDEAYREFSGREFDRTPLARDRQRLILVRTYSKAFAAAGLRLGYLLASGALGRELGKIIPPFHLSQFAAVAGAALWGERALFARQAERIVAERERLRKALGAVRGLEALPSHANFFLLRSPDADGLFNALRERGILVRKPGDDPALRSLLRVTAGLPEENDRLVRAAREILGA
ncbi:MAG: pyridoxal phosphate-dependent aminotransferase [Thermoanaerobaculia bacterium]